MMIMHEGGDARVVNLAFSVDTHLLRELGALLVGRDSTALVELIKNAYDADATRVTVYGEQLGEHGLISIRDDGHGMTFEDFEQKFLRIAGRSKEGGTRRSPRFERKYTGAKGIGRLSSHKLGEALALESTPDLRVLDRSADNVGFEADINWSAIEANEASIDEAKDIQARPAARTVRTSESGTLLSISRLHSQWTPRLLNSFLSEVRSTRADGALTHPLPSDLFVGDALMPTIDVADTGPNDTGFSIELSGDFDGSEPQWPTLLSRVSWMLEIDARDESEVIYRIAPAVRTLETYPDVVPRVFKWHRPTPGPRFAARIFIRDKIDTTGPRLPDVLARFVKESAGIRLFFEGFRVLPYGTPRNDWLGLGAAYSRRSSIDLLEQIDFDRADRSVGDERTYQLSNENYFGAVFLHDAGRAGLEMVVNREGFLPGDEFDQLTEILKRGINISVRLRASLGAEAAAKVKKQAADERADIHADILDEVSTRPTRGDGMTATRTQERLDNWIQAGEEAASALRIGGARSADPDTARNVAVVSAVLEEVRAVADESAREQAQLRVLASLGTQVGAFVHEINGVLGQARTVTQLLDRLASDTALSAEIKSRLRSARNAQNEVVASLERQAIYLTDSIGAEARRRRVRLPVRDRWNTAMRLLGGAAARRNVTVTDLLPADLKSPPMFPAEMNVIFSNVLSNAIKAAARFPGLALNAPDTPDGRVEVKGEKVDEQLRLRIENTGVAVDLGDSERWFRPFETTTSDVDAALGQGLGLGLSLTRRIIEEYGGGVRFVEPSAGMSTALELWLPDRR